MKKVNILEIVTLGVLFVTFVILLIQKEYVMSLYVFMAIVFCIDNILSKKQMEKLLHNWDEDNETKHSIMKAILDHDEKVIDEFNNLGKMIVSLSDELERIDPENKVLSQIKKEIEKKYQET